VTNSDAYEKLIIMAKISFRDLITSYENNEWNAVIRRAQEVVELYLKAMLKMMCIEYPKSHDVGKLFISASLDKGIYIDPSDFIRIEALSKDLAEKRSPSFYMEVIYTQQNAEKAKADAEFVMNFAESLSKKLRTG